MDFILFQSENVLVLYQNVATIHLLKIADFGVSKCASTFDEASTIVGSKQYMAPEIFFSSYDAFAVDSKFHWKFP
jgi:serine/threonine protein kinase